MSGLSPHQITLDGSTRQQKLYEQSIELLKLAEPSEGYYLATSFGKDSIAVQRLCDESGVKYDAHHNITGIDPPELVYYGRKHYPDVQRHWYSESMWQLIKKNNMPPFRNSRYCCEVLKEGGGAGRVCVMGLRAAESTRRAKTWSLVTEIDKSKRRKGQPLIRMHDNDDVRDNIQSCATQGKLVVSPLLYWQDSDLWDFIKDRGLPYCELYDQGFTRIGCIGCPMASDKQRAEQFDRYPKIRRQYIRCFDALAQTGKYDKIGAKNGEDIMRWWLGYGKNKPIPGQITMD